jgi:hypothetical protein
LIDLYGADEDFNPRLVDTSSLDPSTVRYTTLSHRGTDEDLQPLRTLRGNVEKHMESILPGIKEGYTIPQTFEDAIAITLT